MASATRAAHALPPHAAARLRVAPQTRFRRRHDRDDPSGPEDARSGDHPDHLAALSCPWLLINGLGEKGKSRIWIARIRISDSSTAKIHHYKTRSYTEKS